MTISLNEAQNLMNKFIELRTALKEDENSKDILKFKNHERICRLA